MSKEGIDRFKRLMGAGSSDGVVPQWVKDLAVEEDGEILSLEALRKLLGEIGCTLSDDIIAERYDGE